MIVVVGLSHHTAEISIREQVALSPEDNEAVVRRLCGHRTISEVFAVSTCNRVEIIACSSDDSPETVYDCQSVLAAVLSERSPEAARVLYRLSGSEAVRHLVRVASSLDSLVVGEAQILGQLKRGFERAREHSAVGSTLHQLFARATRGAKRIRTETNIGSGQVSVPSIAIDLAAQIFGNLAGRRAVLIGSGEMGQSVARLLGDAGATLSVVGRSLEKVAPVAAKVGGNAALMDAIPELLLNADVVVSSTSAPGHVLGPHDLEGRRKARRGRNLFIIDLAVPRDIDPRVGGLDSVFLYDVDDLSQVARESTESRLREAEAAERIVDEVVLSWERRFQAEQVTPTIKALRAKLRRDLEAEFERSLRGRLRGLDHDQRAALAKMLEAGINRFLHDPVTHLREEAGRRDPVSATELAATLHELFELGEVPKEEMDVSSVRYGRSESPRKPVSVPPEDLASDEDADEQAVEQQIKLTRAH